MHKKIWMLMLCGILLGGLPSGILAQTGLNQSIGQTNPDLEDETEEAKQRADNLREMENLIRVAREAGFNEDELRDITVERDGEKINVWDFVQTEKERLALAKKEEEVAAKKRFITVNDITEDLNQRESRQISNLRDRLLFSGEDEQ